MSFTLLLHLSRAHIQAVSVSVLSILCYTIVSNKNNEGLVCVAFHSLFQCVGLAVELWAGAAEKDRVSDDLSGFSYGYQRLEVLSAFGNTVFLIFVSLFTLEHAIERIFEPPMVSRYVASLRCPEVVITQGTVD